MNGAVIGDPHRRGIAGQEPAQHRLLVEVGVQDQVDQEPLPAAHPLRTLPNVIATPHIGYVAHEVYEVFYKDTAADVIAFLDGAPSPGRDGG